ncbi:B-cell CLL/lymphoma 6 member B protein isoform X1 [Halyomorpha halys]|uniref:B-cell CLL/lymphoma 6 member B protein isoform X1 n=1 Tax=Halyomorpha halys TaxID=286706 RepID=UPI0006D4E131|nr:zinc finger protein 628 isoform X1 [Halyomorpha halys]
MDLLRYRDELIITRITNRNGTDHFRKNVIGDSSDGLDWSLDILPVMPKTNSGNNHLINNNVRDIDVDRPRNYVSSLQENHISSLDDDYSGSLDDECDKSFEEDNKTSIEDESEYTTDMLPAAFCEATVCKEEPESTPVQPDTTGASTVTDTPKQKKFRCSDCNYSTDVSSHFRAHKRRHTGERPYACPLCPYRAAESCTLNRHKLTHSGAKKHFCPLCPYRAFLAGDVAKHMRCHTGERPYSCPLCPYRASRRSSVKEHLATHSLNKEYPCDLCGHKCATRIQLRRHVKNKHFLP